MAQIRLAEYRHGIAEQIEQGHIDEAIAHCRHVLAHYPRYLPAYKLLAHACLEKGDFSHANHFFQCVLSADLEDTDAWINLALLMEDLGETQQAIWFLERAFEVAPGNARVRDMLRQLYVQRDGAERTRIKLTPTALARLYAKGGFYQRAIRELEKMLQQSANLPRLQVATLEVSLAQALWNSRDRTPLADQVCQSLLAKVPYSLQANLILGGIRSSAGRDRESESFLQVARSLDPEGELAQELFGHRSPLPLQEVMIPYLEYKAPEIEETQAVAAEAEDTSWLDRIGVNIEPLDLEDEQKAPAWIKNWTDNETLMPTASGQASLDVGRSETESASVPSGVESPQDTDQVPDWLLEVQRESATSDMDEDIPDWLQDLPGQTEGEMDLEAVEQLPDWLQELDTKDQSETFKEAEEQPTLQGDLPEWLLALSEAKEPGAETILSAQENESTDWSLDQEAPRLPGQVQPEKTTRPLRAPTTQEDAVQPEQVEELPHWFDELRQEAETAVPAEPLKETALMSAAKPPARDEVPDWLREMSESETETPDTPTPIAEKAKGTAPLPAVAAAGPVSQMTDQEPPPSETKEGNLPDWLQELEAEISGAKMPVPEDQALAPTKPKPSPARPSETIEPVALAAEAPLEEEQPKWLSELDEQVAALDISDTALEPGPEDEIPDWLRELDRGEPGARAGLGARTDQVAPSAIPDLEEPEEEAEEDLEGMPEAALEPMPDDELPDWLQELRAESALAETLAPTDQEADEFAAAEESLLEATPDEELPDWLQLLRPADEPQSERAAFLARESEPVLPATPAEPQPELPETAPAPADEMENMEWLRELEEAAIDEMPQGEPETIVSTAPTSQPPPETELTIEEPAISSVEPPMLATSEAPPEPTVVKPPQIEETPVPEAQDAETRLALARARLSESSLDDSAQEYERLVQEPDLAGELVEELEEAVQAHPDHHALQRVLGDAYMRTGKLQKALEAYRQALSKL